MLQSQAAIASAPRHLAGWVAGFDVQALPVLQSTAEALHALRTDEDQVDAHRLTEVLDVDPLMIVKLLAHVAALRHGREGSDVETVTEALVMLGITPFFRTFANLTTVEDQLAGEPGALDGFRAVLRRAHRAARFAMGFAVHRLDPDAMVIREAALLHDFAELLLWLRAPALAQHIAQRQRTQSTLRSAAVQQELLHIDLGDLQQALMSAWRLPALLAQITDDRHSERIQVRNVLLAIRIARHSATGWDNAALPDDVNELAVMLNLGVPPTLRLLRQIDAD